MNQPEKKNLMKTGDYRSPDDISKFKIRVLIKEIRSTIPIKSQDLEETDDSDESRVFSWQEKVLNRSEIEYYRDEKNCITDLQKSHHKDISKLESVENILFSYTEDDEPTNIQPFENCVGNGGQGVGYLYKQMNELRIHNKNRDSPEKTHDNKAREFDFRNSLEGCLTTPFIVDDNEYMYIMADLGEKIDNVWLKSEHILCTIKFNSKQKMLQIYPDFSLNQDHPYVIEIKRDRRCVYNYFIFNASERVPEELYENEFEILTKINQQITKPKLATAAESNFEMPPKNKLKVHIFLEILNGFGFEYDNIFVHYFVDLPHNWTCEEDINLQGVTHTCKAKGWKKVAHFGHPFEITLLYDIQDLEDKGVPSVPCLFLEVVSRDSWDRYRTEGLTYKSLPISSPGQHRLELQCLRVLPQTLSGNLRRYFVGDHTLDDITWIGVPTDYKNSTINKYGVDTVGTGTLNIRLNVVQHSQAFLKTSAGIGNQESFIWERLNAATLVKSVQQVLAAFKKARRNIKQARKNV